MQVRDENLQSLGREVFEKAAPLHAQLFEHGDRRAVCGSALLDARLVNVEAGSVTKAARADGPVSGFVDVEKTLVSALLDGLEVKLAEEARKKLVERAPTRSFDAFAHYSAGLDAEAAGRVDEARADYASALTADPAFAEASSALGALRQQLDAAAASRLKKTKAARVALLEKVLAAAPEPTKGNDRKQKAAFVVRLMALHELGQSCERYIEMRRYLDTAGWTFPGGDAAYKQLSQDAVDEAVRLGLAPAEKDDPQGHRDLEFRVMTEGSPLFSSVGRYFYNFPSMLLDVPSSTDLTATMARCLTPPEQLAELDRLREAVRAHGVAAEHPFDYPAPLDERLEWSALAVRAAATGLDDAAVKRLADLVAAYDDTTTTKALGGGTPRQWAEMQARRVTDAAVAHDREVAAALGWTERGLSAAIEAVAAADPASVRTDVSSCITLMTRARPMAQPLAGKPAPAWMGAQLAPLRDLGCLTQAPARWESPAAALAWIEAAPLRARPENADACRDAFARLPTVVHPAYAPDPLVVAADAIVWYDTSLVSTLCVSD